MVLQIIQRLLRIGTFWRYDNTLNHIGFWAVSGTAGTQHLVLEGTPRNGSMYASYGSVYASSGNSRATYEHSHMAPNEAWCWLSRSQHTHTHAMYVCMYVCIYVCMYVWLTVCIYERCMILIIGPFISRYKLLWTMLNVTRGEMLIFDFFLSLWQSDEVWDNPQI